MSKIHSSHLRSLHTEVARGKKEQLKKRQLKKKTAPAMYQLSYFLTKQGSVIPII